MSHTATIEPPIAVRQSREYRLHGQSWWDDYAWMRQPGSAEVQAYLEAENAYTKAMTADSDALRRQLYEEMVGRIQETDLSVPVRHSDYLYYSRTVEGLQYPVYARKRDLETASEEVLLDLNELAEGHDYFDLGELAVSPDHRLLAYSYDTVGSEELVLVVKDLDRGELLVDRIERTTHGLEWAEDGRTLLYTTFDHARRPYRIVRHLLGADPATDVVVYEEPDERFRVDVVKCRSRRFLFVVSASYTSSEVRWLPADEPEAVPRLFRERREEVEYYLDHHGEHFYVYTNEQAVNFRLARVGLDAEEGAPWEEVIGHRPEVKIAGLWLFSRWMIVLERERGLPVFRVRSMDGSDEHRIEMPEDSYALSAGSNPELDQSTFRLAYSSPVTPPTVYDYDLVARKLVERKREAVLGGYDRSLYDTRRVFARADDGTEIPVSLVWRKGTAGHGGAPEPEDCPREPRPCVLTGYGAYGISLDPGFSSNAVSLLDRGLLLAVAHVRGGGELGEPWHRAGRMLDKPTSFSDFERVAEHLIAEGLTGPDRLLIRGGSAGGLLVGAVVNRRPELFAAVVAEVPFVDVLNTMLDEDLPLTVGEFEEWGDPKDPRSFAAIRAYSPYDNVRPQRYPAMLVTAGLHDTRVQYWEPAKWVAKLRAAKTDDAPLLLETKMDTGHSGASGRYDDLRERAFVYAFILTSIGSTRRRSKSASG